MDKELRGAKKKSIVGLINKITFLARLPKLPCLTVKAP